MNYRIYRNILFILIFLFFFLIPLYPSNNNEECLRCHSDKDIEAETERGKKLILFIPKDTLAGSTHEDLSCIDCHTGARSFEDIPHSDKPLKKDCSKCHEDVYDIFTKEDIHGMTLKSGNLRAPNCWTCHGGHQILPLTSPESKLSKNNQPQICGKCHGGDKVNSISNGISKRNLITRYMSSVHWEAIKLGKNGATCTDCHSHHNILSSASPQSGVSRIGVANSCRKCHPNESKSFWSGAHGHALYYGNNDVPNCTTCHGDHDMASLRIREGDAKQWASTQVCIWCHNNERMMARYGLNTTPVESYMNDFHGLTQRGTLGASATCADCHDPHHSLPSSHPSSRMHITNRGAACGKCHGKVSKTFFLSFSHKKALAHPGTNLENIVRNIYIILIIGTVSAMLFYNFLIWIWAVRKKYSNQKKKKQIKRMTRYERISHIVLFLAFLTLAVTGFALKFPEAFWARWLFELGINESIRAFIHRFAAFTMTIDLVIFAIYMIVRKRGRCIFSDLRPKKRDFSDFVNSVKFYLGIIDKQPKSSLFNFGEKFEFWALIWGTLIMLLTGIILWLPKSIPEWFPPWIISVTRVIHYYEALLATLAIVIWHLFHTIFHPDEYPMNTSWLTGYINEDDATHRFEDKTVELMKKK